MKKKLYIETSVWNQLEHDDRPQWRQTAEQFIDSLAQDSYEAYISKVVVDEIAATSDLSRRQRLAAHINKVDPVMLELDAEAQALVDQYMTAGVIQSSSRRVYNDCGHVAIATVNAIRHIVSFNCVHLVNDRRIDAFNAVNFQNGYDHVVDISTPEKFVIRSEPGEQL